NLDVVWLTSVLQVRVRSLPHVSFGAATSEGRPMTMIGQSRPFRDLIEVLAKAAQYDATVLIEGETGTGKELAARAIHYDGPRRSRPFVPVNCGSLADSL